MHIIPAVDIKDGKCVRLFQGDYSQVTVFSNDPVEMALRWQEAGARFLHVVDLDGADAGSLVNFEIISRIARSVDMLVEVGGGIRSLDSIERLLGNGVERVILGTVAVENAEMVEDACGRWADRVVVGIDARDGLVAIRGWKQTSTVSALDLGQRMVKLGVGRFVYTDISRDGTLTQPNYQAMGEFVNAAGVPVIASGGVSSVDQLEPLSQTGVEGVIIGRAIYTGALDLREAIKLVDGAGS
ncbi:MAG: 1-(5-phosphoribosyl)-5-[(5-phosphoribosylamino)methylideneamino]imidazole-4-carboxamide isomerase [Chloroflexi bacterium]|nr:1-(5-phosphoribosyl)-5-[(5-phosphoribosylamino)methylideneamino]imidazole-4-carboxamide isomerase [Chloroflexota bacterium]